MSKILLIEDDFPVRFTLEKLLIFLDNEVEIACNGEEGLSKVQMKTFFDIIICDIDMPMMDGFCCLEKILKLFPKPPFSSFIFISAYVDQNIIQRVLRMKADCVIKKPIDQEILKIILLALRMKHEPAKI
ncbi:MAG: response regulator [Puniceicoccales bacterium]|jgi:CheY-like chemotaxis protein|nr:response regulator [Puniceicoccales bacterium]